jgi:GNAT superfamily N-acetyltransferase
MLPAGSEIAYSVTWLAMDRRPEGPRPPVPSDPPVALLAAHNPPPWYFLCLYDAVGADYEWTDWHRRPRAELEDFLCDPKVTLYTLLRQGWPAGFFMHDLRQDGTCDLAYFGLVPQAAGQGLGSYLLRTAIHMGWDHPGVLRMTVNTNTLDHPRALGLYQRAGFHVIDRTQHRRTLARDWLHEVPKDAGHPAVATSGPAFGIVPDDTDHT